MTAGWVQDGCSIGGSLPDFLQDSSHGSPCADPAIDFAQLWRRCYIIGFSAELRKTLGGFGVLKYYKPTNTLQQLLVHTKDPVGKDKVYKISCEECDATCVGDTKRSLKAWFGGHRRASSTTSEVSKHARTHTHTRTAPTKPSHSKRLRYCPWNTNGVKGEWRRQSMSRPWNLYLTDTADDKTCPLSGVTTSMRG